MCRIFLLVTLLLIVNFIFAQEKQNKEKSMQNFSRHSSETQLVKFPNLEAKTLAKRKIIFPSEVKGQKAFLVLVFEDGGVYENAQNQADKWAKYWEDNLKGRDVVFYEIPMMSGKYGLVSFWINAGMRSGIAQEKHDAVACFYGDKSVYARLLGVSDLSQAYVFLLDENGNMRCKESGLPDEMKSNRIISQLK
jgi:hypothetical protein